MDASTRSVRVSEDHFIICTVILFQYLLRNSTKMNNRTFVFLLLLSLYFRDIFQCSKDLQSAKTGFAPSISTTFGAAINVSEGIVTLSLTLHLMLLSYIGVAVQLETALVKISLPITFLIYLKFCNIFPIVANHRLRQS